MLFKWDETKNIANIERHHISFEEARYVFADPFSRTRVDYHESENRRQLMGHLIEGIVVLVVYTKRSRRDEDVIRIISSRKATKQEKRSYEKGSWVKSPDERTEKTPERAIRAF